MNRTILILLCSGLLGSMGCKKAEESPRNPTTKTSDCTTRQGISDARTPADTKSPGAGGDVILKGPASSTVPEPGIASKRQSAPLDGKGRQSPSHPGQGWTKYGRRYALIVMGPAGNERLYRLYWNTCFGQYRELVDHFGFSEQNIRFLSNGEEARRHKEQVHGEATTKNAKQAYEWAASVCGPEDLLYVYWISHGDASAFNLDRGVPHGTLASWMKPIGAKVIVGVYQPCNSGAVIDEISGTRVITLTSTDPNQVNNFPWAENIRLGLLGSPEYMDRSHQMRRCSIPADADQDGVVTLLEAYTRAAKVHNRERPLLDDNGDGEGGNLADPQWNPKNAGQDGHASARYSLFGWR